MTDLDAILNNLSEGAHVSFLHKAYSPGNMEVADKLIEMQPYHTDILEKEIQYARENHLTDRFVDLSKKMVDTYFRDPSLSQQLQNLHARLKDWNTTDITTYAIGKIITTSKNVEPINQEFFYHAEKIVDALGKSEDKTKLLENILEFQLNSVSSYKSLRTAAKLGKWGDALIHFLGMLQVKEEKGFYKAANTCVDLGKFDQAIDLYLLDHYRFVGKAFEVAEKHAPERLSEIAKKGFRHLVPTWEDLYIKSAEILGKTEIAKKKLVQITSDINLDDNTPTYYLSLIKNMKKLGLKEKAKEVAQKLVDYRIREDDLYLDDVEQLETLLEETGEKLSDYPGLREKKLEFLEQRGEFDEAEKLALELGKSDKVENYRKVRELLPFHPKEPSHETLSNSVS